MMRHSDAMRNPCFADQPSRPKWDLKHGILAEKGERDWCASGRLMTSTAPSRDVKAEEWGSELGVERREERGERREERGEERGERR